MTHKIKQKLLEKTGLQLHDNDERGEWWITVDDDFKELFETDYTAVEFFVDIYLNGCEVDCLHICLEGEQDILDFLDLFK